MKSLKNSFIFLETIVSLVVILIIVTSFSNISSKNDSNKKYKELLKLSNELKKEDYSNTNTYTKTLNIKYDGVERLKTINIIEKNSATSNNIKLVKYE